ncbi:hypothetical protein EXIGLDRAFT_723254 [Exidia glandulosa HHB12029]|uniref:Uncharacterized protein n=1 Tax=Exidia glandulosa HHB12029 TaxID=1314781 RepID=A0A165EXF9_EXIGL|nr:hypothetical protein EXIGLDRAFT_723254 [Exidia glandulosa HHB12029]
MRLTFAIVLNLVATATLVAGCTTDADCLCTFPNQFVVCGPRVCSGGACTGRCAGHATACT